MSKSRPIVPGEPPESAKPVRRTKAARNSTGPKEAGFSNPAKPVSTPPELTERTVTNIEQAAKKWGFGKEGRDEALAEETIEYVKNNPFGKGGPDEITTA